jgi:hypothetical protein
MMDQLSVAPIDHPSLVVHQLENHKFRGIGIIHDFQSLLDQLYALESCAATMRVESY